MYFEEPNPPTGHNLANRIYHYGLRWDGDDGVNVDYTTLLGDFVPRYGDLLLDLCIEVILASRPPATKYEEAGFRGAAGILLLIAKPDQFEYIIRRVETKFPTHREIQSPVNVFLSYLYKKAGKAIPPELPPPDLLIY